LSLQAYGPTLNVMGPLETDPAFLLTPQARIYTLAAAARGFALVPSATYTLTAQARTAWTITPPARIYEVTA
jgi:hypothetical protein